MATDTAPYVLDMNPRLGGGYPFSHLGGANFPAALIAWLNHELPDPSWLRSQPGIVSCRYDEMVTMSGLGDQSHSGKPVELAAR